MFEHILFFKAEHIYGIIFRVPFGYLDNDRLYM